MKRTYLKPLIEVYRYRPEAGFSASAGLDPDQDWLISNGEDNSLMHNKEVVTEYTDPTSNDYETGLWEF